ncbi:MAG TPA: hypothetical protein VF988_04170 [Verrucomicrobiae bacterium]
MAAPGNERGQMLLAEEYFSNENGLFLDTLRQVQPPKMLAGFADRWKKDPRPWARQQILAYLAQPLDRPGHQPVVKRLFKQAEENKDHELMAAFLVAFDRQVRRRIEMKRRWDFGSRTVTEEERLVTPRDVIPLKWDRSAVNPMTGDPMSVAVRLPRGAKLFRYRTRYYLRRRAWRYFRWLGYRDPAAYRDNIVRALAAYDDADLQRGENILDNWGLLHACFGKHDALEFGATHIQLKDGRSLGELTPAPVFLEAWQKPESAPLLLTLLVRARSRLVRLWATQLFQREHAAFAVPLDTILVLLEHDEAEVQQFGAKMLESASFLATLPVESWLKLLQTRNDEALQRICDAFAKHVSGDRLTLDQCVQLACVRAVPVARLGQRYLKERAVNSPPDRAVIVGLANAKCSAVARELTAWALAVLGKPENYSSDQVIRFFDSNLGEMRMAAWDWLVKESPGLADPTLWSRLAETPHDDLRLRVVDFLQIQVTVPGAGANQLENIWRSVLLGVHRGGRQKVKAVAQIAKAIIENPASVNSLLPVLAVAVRSVRGPEARAGLAAIVSVAEAQPQLTEFIRRLLPELKLGEGAA